MSEQEFKPHLLMIFRFLYPYLFILVIPAIRGLLNYSIGGALPRFLIVEAFLAIAAITIAILKWKRYRLYVTDEYFRFKKGLFYSVEAVIPKSKISSLHIEYKPILWIFRCALMRFDTEAGKPRQSDFEITISQKYIEELRTLLPIDGKTIKRYHSPIIKIVLMALANTSSSTGLLIAAPVVDKAGKLLGQSFSDIWGTINTVSNKLEFIIPPIASTISVVFLIGFGVSFIITLLKSAPFNLYIKGDNITSVSGLISKRKTSFKRDAINDLVITQSPLMRLFRHRTVKVNVAGYGKFRGEIATFLPAVNKKDLKSLIGELLPNLQLRQIAIRPPGRSLHRFLIVPSVAIIVIPLVSIFLTHYFKEFSAFIEFLTIVILSIIAIYISVSLKSFTHGGITLGEHISVYSKRRFHLVELRCKQTKVGIIRITRYPIDRKLNLCRVKLTIRSESADSISVEHLDVRQLKSALREYYKIDL